MAVEDERAIGETTGQNNSFPNKSFFLSTTRVFVVVDEYTCITFSQLFLHSNIIYSWTVIHTTGMFLFLPTHTLLSPTLHPISHLPSPPPGPPPISSLWLGKEQTGHEHTVHNNKRAFCPPFTTPGSRELFE